MTAEGVFPKVDGDIYYGKDVEKGCYQVYDAFEQETLSVSDVSGAATYSAVRYTHLIKNVGSNTAYVNFDAVADADSYLILPNDTLAIDTNATAIHAICAAGLTTTLRIIGQA